MVTSEIYCRNGNVFNTALSKYCRSVLEVDPKLHRISRDSPGLIAGLSYCRFHYAVLDGTTWLSRGNYVIMSFSLREKAATDCQTSISVRILRFHLVSPPRQLRFHCVLTVFHHGENVLTSTSTLSLRFNLVFITWFPS